LNDEVRGIPAPPDSRAALEKRGEVAMSNEAFVARVPIFSNCTPDEILAIDGATQKQSFMPGQIIVSQGPRGRRST